MEGRQRADVCEPRREATGHGHPAGTSDFQPPELQEFLLCEPPV